MMLRLRIGHLIPKCTQSTVALSQFDQWRYDRQGDYSLYALGDDDIPTDVLWRRHAKEWDKETS